MTLALSIILYIAAGVFVVGMARRIAGWVRTPIPLPIVLTPAPSTGPALARRLSEEILGFRAIFEADRRFWSLAWLFHFSLALLLLGHVGGLVIGYSEQRHELAQIIGGTVGLLAAATLVGLLLRRLISERVKWISTVSDYLSLLLLLLVILSGDQLRFLSHVNLEQARQFVRGWLVFHPRTAPNDGMFALHIFLVSLLLAYIPFSKLVHLGGVALFNPVLNQRQRNSKI